MAKVVDALKKAVLVARGAPAATAAGSAGAAGGTGLGIMAAQGGMTPAPSAGPTPNPNPSGGLPQSGQGSIRSIEGPDAPTGDLGQSYLQQYLDVQNNPQFTYLTGGPNQALIKQLTDLSKKKLDLYKSNSADAENMYGQLTTKVEGFGKAMVRATIRRFLAQHSKDKQASRRYRRNLLTSRVAAQTHSKS